jgi:hypothetical protein
MMKKMKDNKILEVIFPNKSEKFSHRMVKGYKISGYIINIMVTTSVRGIRIFHFRKM